MTGESPEGWLELTLSQRKPWTEFLESFEWTGWDSDFESGQYLTIGAHVDGQWVERHYSIASAPGAQLELFLTLVPEGKLTPHLYAMSLGDKLFGFPHPKGKFVLSKVPQGRDLWLIGTGTGLAPFMSMLRDGGCFARFEHVVLVHSVRYAEDLCYLDELETLRCRHAGLRYVAATSRSQSQGALHGRVTTALSDGALERTAGLELSADHSQVMLCGNPAMLNEMKQLLAERGLPMHRRFAPGNVHMEKYW